MKSVKIPKDNQKQ